MAYEFPPKNEPGNPKQYETDLVVLTRSKQGDDSTGFCKDLKGRITAFHFDGIKDDFCGIRRPEKSGAKLKSVDAYFRATDGTHCFIEFKKSTREALEELDDDNEKLPFSVSVIRKAVDSLALSALTNLQGETGKSICDNAVLFVVYKKSVTDTEEAYGFGGKLKIAEANAAKKKKVDPVDTINPKYHVRWNLEDLKKQGLYKDVHTLPDDVFVSWAKDNLR